MNRKGANLCNFLADICDTRIERKRVSGSHQRVEVQSLPLTLAAICCRRSFSASFSLRSLLICFLRSMSAIFSSLISLCWVGREREASRNCRQLCTRICWPQYTAGD
jgi:hypothetical protein